MDVIGNWWYPIRLPFLGFLKIVAVPLVMWIDGKENSSDVNQRWRTTGLSRHVAGLSGSGSTRREQLVSGTGPANET